MRELFVSEQRYIRNILWHWTNKDVTTFDSVLLESYEPPRSSSGIRFNNDYTLYFVPPGQLLNVKAYSATILPNTFGADVFLAVDKDTLQPLLTELLSGEAFSINYYKEYVKQVEDRLKQLSQSVQLKRCAYCRIFVIESDICFLAFPDEEVPVMHGKKRVLYSDSSSLIECWVKNDRVVCFDGWIHTLVKQTDRKLVATAE